MGRRGRRIVRAGIAIVVMVGLAICAYWGLLYYQERARADAPAAATPDPVRVAVGTVGRADIPVTVEGIGTVQGSNTVTIRSRVDGTIVEVAFREGQDVKAGDVLFRIDPRPYKAALDQAKAKLQQDQASLANYRLDLDRSQQLIGRGVASRQTLDTQQAQVNITAAQIEADRAAVEAAQTQLDYTTIRSPIDGRVGLRMVDIGNMVGAGVATSLVVVTQMRPIAVVFTLAEASLGAVREAMRRGPVAISIGGRDAGSQLTEGSIDSIDNQVDPATGTIKLKSVLPNEDGRLWPGQFVNVRVRLDLLRDRLAVPTAAIQRGPNGEFVYVVKPDDTVDARLIAVAGQNEGMTMVAEGLKGGETIVLEGAFRLRPGMTVVPVPRRGEGLARPGDTS